MNASSSILLVDDSRIFLTIEKQFLRTALATLHEAHSAAEALVLCREKRPHLVYIAFELPGQNGAEFCRMLKQDPQLSRIPVIIICEESRPDQLAASQQAGCNGVLVKPLDRLRFLEVGRSFLVGIRELRRSCMVTVRYRGKPGDFTTRGLDINSGGLFLDSSDHPPLGEVLQLQIQLCRPGGNGPWIEATGAVAWINTRQRPTKPSHPPGFGIRFTDMNVQASGLLSDYLTGLERG